MNWKEEVFSLISGESIVDIDPAAARALIIKNLPNYIYKYRAVTEYSKENLDNFTVWMESPDNVNDPFDSAHTLNPKSSISLLVKRHFKEENKYREIEGLVNEQNIKEVNDAIDPISVILEKTLNLNSKESSEKKNKFIDVFMSAIQKEFERFIKWSNDALRDGCKLCSFSEVNDEMLLWSHYAKDHSGFCIEWDMSEFPERHELGNLIYPVLYSENLFDTTKHLAAVIKGKNPNPLLGSAVGMKKSTKWAYEKEWRLFFPIGPGTKSYNFQVPKPSAVFLGINMKKEEKAEIVAICKKHSIPIKQMEISINDYSLNAIDYKDDI